jgi:hypothetical protein
MGKKVSNVVVYASDVLGEACEVVLQIKYDEFSGDHSAGRGIVGVEVAVVQPSFG